MQAAKNRKRASTGSGRSSKHTCRAPACAKNCMREEQLVRHESCCPLFFSWRQSSSSSDALPDERGVSANGFSSVPPVSREPLRSETGCEALPSTHSLAEDGLETMDHQPTAASAVFLEDLRSTIFATRQEEDEDEVAIQRGEPDDDEWELMETGCVYVSDVEDNEEVEKSKSTLGGEERELKLSMDMQYAKRIAETHYAHHSFAPLPAGMSSLELTANARANLEKLWYLAQLQELHVLDQVARGRGAAVRVRVYCTVVSTNSAIDPCRPIATELLASVCIHS